MVISKNVLEVTKIYFSTVLIVINGLVDML